MVQLSHLYMTAGKTIALTLWTFVSKVMSLLFNMLSSFVIVILPRSKCLLISWLRSQSAMILEPKKIKSVTVYIFSPSICYEVMEPNAMILVFGMLSFKLAFFHSPLSPSSKLKRLFSSSSLSAIRVVSSAFWGCLHFFWQSWFQLVIHPFLTLSQDQLHWKFGCLLEIVTNSYSKPMRKYIVIPVLHIRKPMPRKAKHIVEDLLWVDYARDWKHSSLYYCGAN